MKHHRLQCTTVLTGADSTRLWDIGALCPYIHGPAVYLARTMLFSLDSVWFSLRNECEAVSEPPQPPSLRLAEPDGEETVVSDARTIAVHPNPTDGLLQVKAVGYEESPLEWEVHDITGRIIMQGVLKDASIDLRSLLPGIYVLRLSANGLQEYANRFILSR